MGRRRIQSANHGSSQGFLRWAWPELRNLARQTRIVTIDLGRWQDPKCYGLIIAVKTVGGFHDSRLPILHELWGSASPVEVVYLSNESYADLRGANVVDLSPEYGEKVDPSKESNSNGAGHCGKMEAILDWLRQHRPGRRWYVVTDDDTLLNPAQLISVLSSHDDEEATFVGERYGWGHHHSPQGTNYLTTGAGIALSAKALWQLKACRECQCFGAWSTPDDMALGRWSGEAGLKMVHEEGFHQSEPHNFNGISLRLTAPSVSFHRFGVRDRMDPKALQKRRMDEWRSWSRQYFTRPDGSSSASGRTVEL